MNQNESSFMSDEELIRMIQSLRRVISRRMRIKMPEAEEHVYAAFERVYRKMVAGKIRDTGALKYYLYRAAVNSVISEPKTERGLEGVELIQEPEQLQRLIDLEQVPESIRRRRAIDKAKVRLSYADRKLIEHLLRNPAEEGWVTARKLGISHTALRARRARMMIRLRGIMGVKRKGRASARKCRKGAWKFQWFSQQSRG